MTIQEENTELRKKLADYEKLLDKMSSGALKTGTVKSEPHKGRYRIQTRDGDDLILTKSPEITEELEIETQVLYNDYGIIDVLPKILEKPAETTDFDFIDWSQVAGLKSQVKRIQEAITFPFKYHKYYKEYNLAPCKGLLLYGPPGCGKTLIAKAIASYFLKGTHITKDSFIYMKGGEMLRPLVGAAEANIKEVFDRARRNYSDNNTKSVIFIDEAEALLPRRGSRVSSDAETTIVPTFLSEMDGFQENNTFIILATNFPEQLDEAVIRPGRIDMRVEISRPTEEDAIDIFALYLSKVRCSNPKDLAAKASNYLHSKKAAILSGALIKSIVDNACFSAIKRAASGNNNGLTETDLITAIDSI